MRNMNVLNGLCASAAVAVMVWPAAAVARPAYVGNWASSAAVCRAGDPVIELRAKSLLDVDLDCKFRSVTGGNGVWAVSARCIGDSAVFGRHMTLWATKTRLTIRFGNSAKRENYVRCR
jgi:hypothetical protein